MVIEESSSYADIKSGDKKAEIHNQTVIWESNVKQEQINVLDHKNWRRNV